MARPKRMQAKPTKTAPEIPTTLPADLPAPSTCRNLLPRSRPTSLTRSGSKSGSRRASQHSSMSLANNAFFSAPAPSAGGTISLEFGKAIDPRERVSGSAAVSQNGQVQDFAAPEQPVESSSQSAPIAATGSARPQGDESMDFTQGNRNYGWPLHMDGSTPQVMRRISTEEESPSWWAASDASVRQNDDLWRFGSYHYQHQANVRGSSSTSYQTSGSMSMHQPSSSMGGMGDQSDQWRFPSWSNPPQQDFSWNSDQHSPDQPFLPPSNSWAPPHPRSPPYERARASVYNVNMGTSAKRKRSPSGERSQGAIGTSHNPLTSPPRNNDSQYTSNGRYDTEDEEIAEALLNISDSKSPKSQTRPDDAYIGENQTIDRKGKGKARAQTPLEYSTAIQGSSSSQGGSSKNQNSAAMASGSSSTQKAKLPGDPLSLYTCPICFSPPTNATITPCGHICCGECLFAAVKTTLQRSGTMGLGARNGPEARCPVCRAVIPGWDGKGGGVIGLKVRAVFSL